MSSLVLLLCQVYLALCLPAVILIIPPLIVQARNFNFPIIVLLSSILVLNVQNTINAFTWPSWRDNRWNGEILCDIEVRTYTALAAAATGAVACIFRQLAEAFRTDRVGSLPTQGQRIIKWTVELTFCVIIPVIIMSTLHLASAYRYSVTRILGCLPGTTFDWRTIVLQYIWQPISALIGTTYCILTICRLIRHRRNVSSVLVSSGLDKNRHTRLLVVALCGLLVTLPTSAYLFVQSLAALVGPADLTKSQEHSDSWEPFRLPIKVVGYDKLGLRFGQIAMAVPIFLALGLGPEAYRVYHGLMPASVKRMFASQRPETSDQVLSIPTNLGSPTEGSTYERRGARKPMDEVDRELWLLDHENRSESTHVHPRMSA
jgi:pheromone a factor receptor